MKVLLIAPVGKFSVKDSGYGTAASGLATVLTRMKQEGKIEDVLFMDTLGLGLDKVPKEKVDVSITMVHPHTFLKPSRALEIAQKGIDMSERKFLYIMWETDRLPTSWVPLLTKGIFTGFLTPSYFVASLVRSVTDTPVYYAPLYIHTDIIPKVNIDDKIRDENMFSVLYIGQDTTRKGIRDAVVSYMREFAGTDGTRLILKYHRLSDKEQDTQNMIYHATLTNSDKTKARVYSITTMLDKDKMYGLYHMSSLLFFPSRGEGFGLPVAESMAAGIPVIYTNWSSTPEVACADGNIPIDFHLDESVDMFHYGYEIGSKYAVPSISSCMAALRAKYEEWKKDRRAYYGKSAEHRDIITKKFGYEPVSQCIEHFASLANGFAPSQIEEIMLNGAKAPANQVSSKHTSHDHRGCGCEMPGIQKEQQGGPIGASTTAQPDTDQLLKNYGLVCEDDTDNNIAETRPSDGGSPGDSEGDDQEGHL